MTILKYEGIWPVAPTPFRENGSVDYDGMKNVLSCMIDQGVDGICILANYSEQFLLSDDERQKLTQLSIDHVGERKPIIVTISHYSTHIAVERARIAKQLGAAAVMMMPPYHGALLKGTQQQTFKQVQEVSTKGIPIMIQDAPLSGVEMPVELLVKMAKEIDMVKMFKIECADAATKISALVETGGSHIESPFDGNEGITLMADLDAGAKGSMTSSLIPDLIKPVLTNYFKGNRKVARGTFNSILPIINFENQQCGFRATKFAMMKGNVIKSDFSRHPIEPLDQRKKDALIELLQPHEPLVLSWGHS